MESSSRCSRRRHRRMSFGRRASSPEEGLGSASRRSLGPWALRGDVVELGGRRGEEHRRQQRRWGWTGAAL